VSRVVPPTPVPFSSYLAAPYLRAPTFTMVGCNDGMVHGNRFVQQAVFDTIAAPKTLREIEGGPFGLRWSPGPFFDEVATHQSRFLREVFPCDPPSAPYNGAERVCLQCLKMRLVLPGCGT